MSASRDFWLSCGHHLLDRDEAGRLHVTDEFLKAYLARPELMPPPDACAAERGLHRALLRDPRRAVESAEVTAIADSDARENWRIMIAWRDHLVRHSSLEAAYLEIVRRNINFPQILIGQMVQAILRNALDNCADVFVLRAAEMFFRPQRLVQQDMSIIAIDEETESSIGQRSPSPLTSLLGLLPASDIDLLGESNAESYWERSDRFDMGIDLSADTRGMAALGAVITRWLSHLLAIEVVTDPLTELHDAPFSWYVGLSSEGTRIGDAIWKDNDLADTIWTQLIGLFRLTFRDPGYAIERLQGEAVYLLMAITADQLLLLKPQNLIAGLPIRHLGATN